MKSYKIGINSKMSLEEMLEAQNQIIETLNEINKMMKEKMEIRSLEKNPIEPIDNKTEREKMIEYSREFTSRTSYRFDFGIMVKPKFFVNAKKRTVAVKLFGVNSGRQYGEVGLAKCIPTDVFNEEIGKAIALHRALKKTVPVILTHTEFEERKCEKGDIIRYSKTGELYEVISSKHHTDGLTNRGYQKCHPNSFVGKNGKIVDDTFCELYAK
jgi:hypothetical protein